MVKKLSDLVEMVKGSETQTVAVAAGQDPDTITAITRAVTQGVVKAILVGDEDKIKDVCKNANIDVSIFDIVNEPDSKKAALKAVMLVKDGKAQMVMKGLVKTPDYMRAILNKEAGLLPKGGLLSHVTLCEIESYPKLLIATDAAILPLPDLDQKAKMIGYTFQVAHALGIENPKAAIISATETISSKIPSSMDAAILTGMNLRKQITGGIVDGPLALDVALSPRKCEIKGVTSPVGGDADIVVFPNIEAANTFYKSVSLLAGGITAAVVMGTSVPVILTSRSDDEDAKFYSIVMAAALSINH
ncbi:bifunctional enoyl-CoA hydratase/phosphate acetyltransferase [bacterium]|nr:bifunctional enoyl-CoA hydratase/phosphate acetyltransferase [bacterium]